MLTVLGGPAEFERALIRNRTSEGRGVKFGPKPKLTDHQKREALRRRALKKAMAPLDIPPNCPKF